MKKLILIGMVLLVMSIPFFLLAEAALYETETQTNDSVNPVQDGTTGRTSWQSYPFGAMRCMPVKPYKLYIQPGDTLSVETLGSSTYTIIGDEVSYGVLEYTNSPFLYFINERSSAILVEVYVATNLDHIVTTTVIQRQSQLPNPICLSIGVVLVIVGVVLIIRSRRKALPKKESAGTPTTNPA